jgi:glycosyltransferase involved in cell wall biosynthesis
MMDRLSRGARIRVVTLGAPSADLEAALERCGVKHVAAPYAVDGWDVTTCEEITAVVASMMDEERLDLLVLSWELWDVVTCLAPLSRRRGVPFAVALHSLPLLDAPSRPTGDYQADLDARLAAVHDARVADYIRRRRWSVEPTLREVAVLAVNRTVAWMLRQYFPALEPLCVEPSYAVERRDAHEVVRREPAHDAAFMAKLVPEKGIFDLLECVARIRRDRPSFRCIVIGDFDDDSVRARFMARADQLEIAHAITVTGWLDGEEKYGALASARLFLYPAAGSDTFCISMLEALAAGLPVLCYDAPFVRHTYRCAGVKAVELGEVDALAREVLSLLSEPLERERRAAASSAFAAAFASWDAVAEAELRAYDALARRKERAAWTR